MMLMNRTLLRISLIRNWKRFLFPLLAIVVLYLVVTSFNIDDVTLSRFRHNTALLVQNEDEIRLVKLRERMFRSPVSTRAGSPFKDDFSRGQTKVIDTLLGRLVKGFFVEIGAGDGETKSVSYFFEKQRAWDGVLIEKDETKYKTMLAKNRQCILWNVNVDFSTQKHPLSEKDIKVSEIFRLINRTDIDLLIVNMKDFEFDLVQAIDFGRYRFKAITIEMENPVFEGYYAQITTHLTSRKYKVAHHIIDDIVGKKDIVYIHECVPQNTCESRR